MKNTDNFNEVLIEEEGLGIKNIIFILLRHWYWFLLFGVLGLGGAYLYDKFTKPIYSVSSSILIPEESGGLAINNLFEGTRGMMQQNYTKINNQIEILKSSFTINQTLLNLNWRTDWYKKEMFVWNGIYKHEPFDIREPQNFLNPTGIKIYITPTSDKLYTILVDGEITEMNFEAEGEFDKPFKNDHFNFTILKKDNNTIPEGEYYFEFRDQKRAALVYQNRLAAYLKDERSDIVVCTLVGEEPEKDCDFLNELIDVYILQKLDLQNEAQLRSLDFINSQLEGISDSLEQVSTDVVDFRSSNDIIDLGAEGTMVMNKLREVESEKTQSQMQLDYFQNVLSYLEENGDLTKLVSPSVVGIQDASLNALVVKLGELYSRRQILAFTATANNTTLVLLDKELAQARTQLNENLRNLIDNGKQSINSLNTRQEEIYLELNKLPQKEQQMINIQRKYTLTNEIYTLMLKKRAEINISLASSISDVKIIETARPETAVSQSRSKKVVFNLGFIVGLAIPALFILLINFFDDRIRTQKEIEKRTQLPILGNIMHNPDNLELSVFRNPKTNFAESFRELRTNLEFMLTSPKEKVISIHSTNPGEGKTYNSTNLATIFAMNDNKVLLIGGDMRKPKLHKIFEIDNQHGLSTYLAGLDTFEQVIIPTIIENLSVLPSGPIPPNPSELMGKPRMKELIEKARNEFDYIIIDNAPIAVVTDGIIASYVSDLNVFILRFGVSHLHQLEMINQYATSKKVTNIGIIVNDIKSNSFGNTYYKYYQYEAYKNSYYTYEDKGGNKRIKKKKTKKA